MDDIEDITVRGGDEPKTSYRCEDDSDSESAGGSCCRIQKCLKVLIVAVALVLILVIIFCVRITDGLPMRLASQGWVLMTREGCPHCEHQLEVLGGTYPKVVRCGSDNALMGSTAGDISFGCGDVPGFPYWYNTDTQETKVGFQDQSELKSML